MVSVPAGYEGDTFAGVPVEKPTVSVTGVTLDKATAELTVGETTTLTATVAPDNATNKNVTWSSSDESVATVDETGTVTAVGEGTTTITVTTKDGNFTASCEVIVTEPVVAVTGVTLDAITAELKVGDTATLTATIAPEDATDKTVIWTSSDESVAIVDENGKVTAVGAGTATITATAGGKTASCTVTVSDVPEPTPEPAPAKKNTPKYDVDVDRNNVENGSVTVSSSRAKKGSTVTITVTPDAGYELDELFVLDDDGDEIKLTDKGNGKFTFKMPRGDVEIRASFREMEEEITLVLTIDQVKYWLNGEHLTNDVTPIIKGGRTMLPIRLVAETLGATVAWNEAEQSVTIGKGNTEIVIYIGQAFALVNGDPVSLDAPACIQDDRTYLPVRFVAENLGADVVWDATAQTVTITAGI